MKLRELRLLLNAFSYLPDDTLVLIASDEEGNSIGPLATVDETFYQEYEDTDEIDLIHPDDFEGDEKVGLILWP